MSKRLITLTDDNLDHQIHHENGKPVLVDFWAAWCRPCRAMTPTLEALGETYSDRVIIGKLDVDESPLMTSRYSVLAIPTLILFNEGQEQERLIGAQSKKVISDLLDRYVDPGRGLSLSDAGRHSKGRD